MKRPPKQGARWIADHPAVGRILFGPVFAASLAVNFLLFTDLSPIIIAIVFVFYVLYALFLVRSIRRTVDRWDAAHPAG
ncbi:MAG: hypothetical protein QOC79_1908 [Actinomycetota bacterium]|nr:hypothetical protein [Actinomycetota bacterium]